MKEVEPKISLKNKLTNQLKERFLKIKEHIKPTSSSPSKVNDIEPEHDEYYERYTDSQRGSPMDD